MKRMKVNNKIFFISQSNEDQLCEFPKLGDYNYGQVKGFLFFNEMQLELLATGDLTTNKLRTSPS
jgi:hypothetical protein